MFVDLIELTALDQKANFWFGAGITQEDAAFPGQLALDFLAQFNHFAQFFDRRLRFDDQVALRLRIFLETLFQFAQRLTGSVHDSQNLERANNAVTGSCEIAEDNVPALFATEIEISRNHFFNHVAIAHFGANHFAAVGRERFIQAALSRS